MHIFTVLFGSFFATLSSGILLYVSMTTGLGPWIAPTIVLLAGHLLFRHQGSRDLVIVQTIGSVGGAIGTAIGFSLPTLYFLQPTLFNQWVSNPGYLLSQVGGVVIAAGLFGIIVARLCAPRLLADSGYRFPVSRVITQAITAQSSAESADAKRMRWGVVLSWIIGFLRDGIGSIRSSIPRLFYLNKQLFGNAIVFEISPLFWAIGFIAGTSLVFPMAIGMLSKYLVVYPLNHHSQYLSWSVFPVLKYRDFTMAFCSGIVLYQALYGVKKYIIKFGSLIVPSKSDPGVDSFQVETCLGDASGSKSEAASFFSNWHSWIMGALGDSGRRLFFRSHLFTYALIIASITQLVWQFHLPVTGALLLMLFSGVAVYQVILFGIKTGLAPYGRFMTFVMLPLMGLCSLSDVHIVLIVLFVAVACACGVDLLFGYKVGDQFGIDRDEIYYAQILGVLVASIAGLFLFWILTTHFELGSAQLIAHRGLGRALLLKSLSFNWVVLLCGMLYGAGLSLLRINPTLAFGGLLMPNQLTIGLLIGALLSKLAHNPEKYYPAWSGVFAGESLWILVTLFAK